jgi:hypothetical protein
VIAQPRFRLVLFENGGHHLHYKQGAALARSTGGRQQFYCSIHTKHRFHQQDLPVQLRCIIQLDYPPYGWKADAMDAFIDYMEKGKGGWIGLHHATLLGEFDGYPMWTWFSVSWEEFDSKTIS